MAFDNATTIGKIQRSGKLRLNEIARGGYGNSIDPAGCVGFADGTQDANSLDGDGFTRFTK